MKLKRFIKYNPVTNYLRWKYIDFHQRRYVRELQKKEKINVVFFAMQRSLWKYQNLFEEFKKNDRFHVSIVLSPALNFAKEQQERDMQELRTFFTKSGHPLLSATLHPIAESSARQFAFLRQAYLLLSLCAMDYRRFVGI